GPAGKAHRDAPASRWLLAGRLPHTEGRAAHGQASGPGIIRGRVRFHTPAVPRYFRTTLPTRGISAESCVRLRGIAELANRRQCSKMPVILGVFVPNGGGDESPLDQLVKVRILVPQLDIRPDTVKNCVRPFSFQSPTRSTGRPPGRPKKSPRRSA